MQPKTIVFRIVSAYENRFAKLNPYYNQNSSKADMKKKQARALIEFPRYIQGRIRRDFQNEAKPCTYKLCNATNVHLRPFFDRCAFCDINYDVVGKMETFEVYP